MAIKNISINNSLQGGMVCFWAHLKSWKHQNTQLIHSLTRPFKDPGPFVTLECQGHHLVLTEINLKSTQFVTWIIFLTEIILAEWYNQVTDSILWFYVNLSDEFVGVIFWRLISYGLMANVIEVIIENPLPALLFAFHTFGDNSQVLLDSTSSHWGSLVDLLLSLKLPSLLSGLLNN